MKDTIAFSDFQKLDLQTAIIVNVEPLQGTDKIYKVQIDLGGQKRQILAGLRPHYQTEELIGKQVVVLVNLKPKKIRGEISEGMLLAADADGKVVLISPVREIPAGTTVR